MGVLKAKVSGSWVEIPGVGTPINETPVPWIAVTFQNGWVNESASIQPVQYRKIGDIVYLRGSMKSGTIGAVAFTLPVGYRPVIQQRAIGWAFTPETLTRADIHPNGDYQPYGGTGATQFRLVDYQFSVTA